MALKVNLKNMRLYVLISSNIATMPIKETVELVVNGGADVIQLREKTISDNEFISLARKIRDISVKKGTLLIINDRVNVAKEVNADGVHLGQSDMGILEARNIIGSEKIIGISTHNIVQAKKAQEEGADYVAVGPIYSTETKKHEPPVGLGLIQEAVKEIEIPFVVIGAINLENLDEVLKAGAKSVAVCSAIISSKDIFLSTKQFREKLDSVK